MKNKIFKIAISLLLITLVTGCGDNTEEAEVAIIKNPNLIEISSEEYGLFVPEYYMKIESGSEGVLYTNVAANTVGGSNNITLRSQASTDIPATPSDGNCEQMANQLAGELEATYQDHSVINERGMVGCYFASKASILDSELISESKVISKDGELTIYALTITYEISSEPSEIKDLQDALNQFSIR